MLALLLTLALQEVVLGEYVPPSPEGTRFEEHFDPETGLLRSRAVLEDGDILEYERPVVVLPARLEPGEVHTSQRRFVRLSGGEKRDVGAHHFEAELVRVEDAAGFDDCLVVRRREVRMDFSGAQEVVEVLEWYARGAGVVRSEGERILKDSSGGIVVREILGEAPRR